MKSNCTQIPFSTSNQCTKSFRGETKSNWGQKNKIESKNSFPNFLPQLLFQPILLVGRNNAQFWTKNFC